MPCRILLKEKKFSVWQFFDILQAARLEKQHKWIAEEKHHFGRAGTAYDFTDYSIEKGNKELEERTARKHVLERSINAKAMNMLGTAEEQVHLLLYYLILSLNGFFKFRLRHIFGISQKTEFE